MEFDKSKVFTPFNCEEVKIGSVGYFADYKENLIECVQSEDKAFYLTLKRIENENDNDYAFIVGSGDLYRYFYLVEEPKEPTKRPCTREELVEMLKKQGLPMLMAGEAVYTIENICNVVSIAYAHYSYKELCETFTLLDGTELWVEE